MKEWLYIQRTHWSDRNFLISSGIGMLFLVLSLVINYQAGTYAAEEASNAVTDVILSNIRVFDVDWMFVYGGIGLAGFITLLIAWRPQRIPFTLKTIALFVIIRSIFISLTHIAPFPTMITLEPSAFFGAFSFGADLFFSGHTGLPFLMALVFWETKWLRWLFIALAGFFGVIVLMGHLHYSIDVLSAFFITYSIFHIAEKLFKKDRAFFVSKPVPKNAFL